MTVAEEVQIPRIRSREEIEYLKGQWESDPTWDLEETEGFEAHREELAAFAAAKKAEWEAQEKARRERRMEELGISNNVALFGYLEGLERRIERLGNQLEAAEERFEKMLDFHNRRSDNAVQSVRSGLSELESRIR
ncbi:MAG: hypothetical protein ACM3US_09955 [Sphingomonadaceae bacterium]